MKVKRAKNGMYQATLEKHDLNFLKMADTEKERRIRLQLLKYKIEDQIAFYIMNNPDKK